MSTIHTSPWGTRYTIGWQRADDPDQPGGEVAYYCLFAVDSRRTMMDLLSEMNVRLHEILDQVPGIEAVGDFRHDVPELRELPQDIRQAALSVLRARARARTIVVRAWVTVTFDGEKLR